jgi:hypothetical protein
VVAVVAVVAVVELVDQLELIRLVRQFCARLRIGDHAAHEALAGADDAVHGFLERLHVLRRERLLDVEVVVETVRDGRADAELGLRVDRLHRLREHVGGGVAEDVQPVGRVDGDRFDGIRRHHRGREIPEFAVDAHGDNGPVGE